MVKTSGDLFSVDTYNAVFQSADGKNMPTGSLRVGELVVVAGTKSSSAASQNSSTSSTSVSSTRLTQQMPVLAAQVVEMMTSR